MDKTMSQTTRKEILERLRRRYRTAGPKPKRKLLDPAQEWLGDHRKAAVRALGGAGGGAGAVAQRRAPGERRAQRPPALAAADWAGDRLRLWAASGRDVAGGDPGLRGARAPVAGPGAGQAAGGQRAHAGPVAGAPLRGQGQGRSRTRWRWAEAVWPGNLSGCSTGSITRRQGWKCGRSGVGARRERWPPGKISRPACRLRCWAWTATTAESS